MKRILMAAALLMASCSSVPVTQAVADDQNEVIRYLNFMYKCEPVAEEALNLGAVASQKVCLDIYNLGDFNRIFDLQVLMSNCGTNGYCLAIANDLIAWEYRMMYEQLTQ